MKKLLFVILLLVLTACAPAKSNGGSPEDRFYFEGTDGVFMNFLDRDSPPSKIYYYSDTDDNTFDLSIELENKGASFGRGGVYLSGYDPNLIHVFGINPDLSAFGVCGFGIGKNIGFGSFGLDVECDAGRISVGGGGFDLQLRPAIKGLLNKLGWDEVALLGDVGVRGGDTGINIDLGINDLNFNVDYGNRGRLMIALFAGIDFTRHFGIEYLLAGDTPEFPGGDIAVIDWDANIINFPPGLDQTQQTFLFTNCYLYTTHAAPLVCIDPAPFSEGEKVCRPGGFGSKNGQGGPLAITSITQENTPRQAIFTIQVKNMGGGEVWHPGKIEKCSPYQGSRVTNSEKNKVFLGQIRVSGDPAWLDCVPDDFIRLDRDTQDGFVTCRYDIPFRGLRSAYQAPLVVELWYGYEETMRKTVTIKRAT